MLAEVAIVSSITGLATALGLPRLIAAWGEASKRRAEGAANAEIKRAEAARLDAETKRLEAESRGKSADITGKMLVGAEADAETVRGIVRDLRDRLDRCERRHEAAERRTEAAERRTDEVAAECGRQHAAKDAQIAALWSELRELRASITGDRR